MPVPDWQDLAAFAVHVAHEAGRIALSCFRRRGLAVMAKSEKPAEEGGFDPVTEADRKAEHHMRRLIATRHPDHGIRGEEFGHREGKGLAWVLDPIDGTRAFVCGLPTWTVLIALEEEGCPRIGVIHQPLLGETYLGTPEGAWLLKGEGRTPLVTRKGAALAEACAGTTLPDIYTSHEQRRMLRTMRENVRELRYDADAYFYAMVAAGFMDIAFDTEMQPHDMSALIPVVRGAGGCVADWQGGEDFARGNILATASRDLQEALLQKLQ